MVTHGHHPHQSASILFHTSELTLIATMPFLPEEINFEFARFCTLGNDGLPIGGLSFLFGGILFLER